ncbi:cyclase family protein [Aetokthonos hydrillicola Thurmond2011]|jgi:kynurenine formamidase|uniref:Cyclase family protein n=2 Tax=Aetokthonos TaxID=1550243 RepID=A0AAP5MBY3_9CYAN|nr:cyclase family protein [Aetokthonos hydrillicola]MDR9897394.1 cyclase family protein [Aetokthonos hydrillicola Thurmond2011]
MLLTLTTWIIITLSVLIVVLLIVNIRLSQAKTQTRSLCQWQVVDLTQPLTSTIPIWSGDPRVEIQPWATIANEGYFINRIAIGEHSGTHWATPNTFIMGATSAEQVPVEKLIAPAVVIDIQHKALQDADYRLSVEDVQAWETRNGEIPSGSIVILFTGWQDKWLDPKAFMNEDEQGVSHWPGFSVGAVEFLVSRRQIAGLGTDTHGVDPGNDHSYCASTTIYASDGIVLECLGGLEKLPQISATLVVGGLPIFGGSGSPARVLAFLPPP